MSLLEININGSSFWVDPDAEIKVGDVVAESLMNGEVMITTIDTLNDIDTRTQSKIVEQIKQE